MIRNGANGALCLSLSWALCSSLHAGTPIRVVLYPEEGAPSARNQPYPPPLTAVSVTAGDTVTIVAKVLDRLDVWLTEYEADTAPIQWRIDCRSPNAPQDTLAVATGFKTSFTPRFAFTDNYVIATFLGNGNALSDTVRISVAAVCCNYHLVLEASPVSIISPNRDDPIGSLAFAARDTVMFVYAVLRDAYGNWVGPCTDAEWGSQDTFVVRTEGGDTALGQGRIIRGGASGQTKVAAWSTTTPSWADTLSVENCCPSISAPRRNVLRRDPSISPVSEPVRVYDTRGRLLFDTRAGNRRGLHKLMRASNGEGSSAAMWRIVLPADR